MERLSRSGNTSDMVFHVYQLIDLQSQGTTLAAGTLIMTGRPPGVSLFASNPPEFLKSWEVVECEIEPLETLKNGFFRPD